MFNKPASMVFGSGVARRNGKNEFIFKKCYRQMLKRWLTGWALLFWADGWGGSHRGHEKEGDSEEFHFEVLKFFFGIEMSSKL